MFFRALALTMFIGGYIGAMVAASGSSGTYQLVTYKDGQRYVDDFGLTAEDCRDEMAKAFQGDVDAMACERQ
jgi:hypothetical protein